ncbi:hypothetical protein Xoosp13_378 [Xanthomonas phage Xoo-sp13]|nr:hypothetical protein Xoosp13_378 [Xanthomonas phage Xoo-sp13]
MDTLNRQFNKVYSGILFIDTYVNALHYVEQTVFEANNYIGEYHVLPGDHGIPLYITLSEAIIPVGSFYYLGKDNGLGMTNKLCHGRPLYQTACRDKKTVL